MLGLGNAINKARRRTVFVSVTPEGDGFDALAFGSLGEAGYVVSWFRASENGLADENGGFITYTEVYPSHYYFGDEAKSTAVAAAEDVLAHVEVGETEEGEAVNYSGWRFAAPPEFQGFLDHVYSNSELSDQYHEGDDENPYLVVAQDEWNSWSGFNPIPPIEFDSRWNLNFTDGSTQSPTIDQLNSGSFYFLVVRQFTKQIQWTAETQPPALSPIPLQPNPDVIQSRGSEDLLSSATDEDNFESINLSVNGELLSQGSTQFYIADPTYSFASGQNSDSDNRRFRLYFTISFPTDPSDSNSAFFLPAPWSVNNSEQKYIDVSAVILGYEDKPLYNPVEADTTVFSSTDQQEDYFERRVSQRVFLNKVPGVGGLPDGFFLEGTTFKFGYEGYLDMQDFNAMHVVSFVPGNPKFKEAFSGPSFSNYVSSKKRAFLMRVDQVSYGTTTRPSSDPIGLPEGMSHIIFPILTETNCQAQYNAITGDADYPILSMFNSVQSDSSLPPEIPGQTEDYYD